MSARPDRRHGCPAPPRHRPLLFLVLLLAAAAAVASAPAAIDDVRGLPLTRFYPFEEIGNVSRGARLNFDPFGRLAVIHDGAYIVLNDSTWIDIVDRSASEIAMLNVVEAAGHQSYYGALGSWGVAEFTAQGKVRARSLVPADRPAWINSTNFVDILGTRDGVCFAGWNGVVHYNPATRVHTFIQVPEVARMFSIGEQVYVSSHNRNLHRIDVAHATAIPIPGTDFDGVAIDQTAPLDDRRVLISTVDGRVHAFDGTRLTPWLVLSGATAPDRVNAIQRLVDGGIALAISGRGLYVVSTEGEVLYSLNNPEYQRITSLASREPGVLWAATESGIEKVLYGSAVTIFGQRLGLPISWPQVVHWRSQVVVASAGRLYEALPAVQGGATRFQFVGNQPAAGAWGIAASGSHLLIGNAKGIYAAEEDGRFTQVSTMEAAKLVMLGDDFCFAIGATEITALRWTDGRWQECAPRVPGFGYPSITHASRAAAWIELGPNRAARVSLRDGQIRTRLFEQFPWHEPRWINIGIVGDTIILSGPTAGRVFFDEKTETFCEAPRLQKLLDEAPSWIARVREDADGTLWCSHERGVLTIKPKEPVADIDAATFDVVNDRFPHLQLFPGGDVWITTGYSLYHVDRRSAHDIRHAYRPILISVFEGRTNEELLSGAQATTSLQRLPYAKNNLSFRFFAGSYALRRAPVYQFRLNHGGGAWTTTGTGSVMTFPELRPGAYELEVRLSDSRGPVGAETTIRFEILPPWYATWYAYAAYAVAAALAVAALVRWFVKRTRARNVVLERLVQERTDELKMAMRKLNEETRNAATLAERNRLAGEIHDSLQQGLSGLILQLDATLKLPGLAGDVRSRLNVARNMVSFTRHEVQHAVWDMESPLLEGTELGDALRKITDLINTGSAQFNIEVVGASPALSSAVKHHLLRIAQEAITNAVRHASAHTIAIRLGYRPESVTLSITDDGVGFKPSEVLSNGIGHFGLRGLRGRADKVGGDLHIDSTPGQGTTITITVPVTSTGQTTHASEHSS